MTEHPLSKHISINFAPDTVVQNILIVVYFHPRKPYFGVLPWFGTIENSITHGSIKYASWTGWDTGRGGLVSFFQQWVLK